MQRIIVSTTKDLGAGNNGEGTFRKAIQTVNEYYDSNPNNLDEVFYIDFEAEDETKTWVIEPDIPLPPILKGNVQINTNETKFIILSGKKLALERVWVREPKGTKLGPDEKLVPSWVKEPKGTLQNQNSSLLTLGDSSLINRGHFGSDKFDPDIAKTAKFTLQGINFSSNKAKGGDGVRGSGGGLGAGGGISVVSGTTHIKDSVFQKLQAIGGTGGSGSDGKTEDGEEFYGNHGGISTNERLADGQNGENGGAGGLRGSFTINTADTLSACTGGNGGNPGDQHKGWEMMEEDISASTIQSSHPGLAGGPGGDAEPCHKGMFSSFGFGNGGGGGGGGGGGSNYTGVIVTSNGGDGGRGGNGGQGGFGAGGGGGGGGGTPWNGGFADQGNSGWNWGNPGSGGLGGTFATRGSNGETPHRTGLVEMSGGKGGNGAALGGAIAVLSRHAKLELTNVDFIDNEAKTSGGAQKFDILFSRNTDSEEQQITAHDVRIYENTESKSFTSPPLDTLLNNAEFNAFIKSGAKPDETAIDGHYSATSYPRNDDLAKIRNKIINLETGEYETVTIRFERPKSGLIDIDINQDQLLTELNGIHKEIIPIEDKKTIEARHQKKLISAAFQLGGDLAGIGNPIDLFSASSGKYTKVNLGTGVASKVIGAAATFAFSAINAKKELNAEIEKNNANIKKLAEKTNPQRKLLDIAPIDISKSRSLIEIDNFTIGEDVLLLEDFGRKNNPKSKGINGPTIKNGTPITKDGKEIIESFEIHLDNTENDAIQTRIATISLDSASVKALNEPIQRNPESYLPSLLYYDDNLNRWVLGKTLSRLDKAQHSGPDYYGGPAGELVILNRPKSMRNDKLAHLITRDKDDIVFGSPGHEYIATDAGMDQITPNLGKDSINAGEGFDKIDFQDIKEPISVLGSKSADINSDIIHSTIQVKFKQPDKNESKTLNSIAYNTEVIAAWGASSIDLSSISEPDNIEATNIKEQQAGYYGIRSGLGSKIQGSPHSDKVIISLLKEENSADYQNTNTTCIVANKVRETTIPDVAFSEILKNVSINNNSNSDESNAKQVVSMDQKLEAKHLDRGRGSYLTSRFFPTRTITTEVENAFLDSNGKAVYQQPPQVMCDSSKRKISDAAAALCAGGGSALDLVDISMEEIFVRAGNSLVIQPNIDSGFIENGLYKKRSETVVININEDNNDDPIDFLDQRMSPNEAYSLLYHPQLNNDDTVEIWDNRNPEDRKLLKSYTNFISVENSSSELNEYPDIPGFEPEQFSVNSLASPATIVGGGGNDELIFIVDKPENYDKNKAFVPSNDKFTVSEISNAPPNLEGFKAVINNQTIIAYIKDIDFNNGFAANDQDGLDIDKFKQERAVPIPVMISDKPLNMKDFKNKKCQSTLEPVDDQVFETMPFIDVESIAQQAFKDNAEDNINTNEGELIRKLTNLTLGTIRNSDHISGKRNKKDKVKGTDQGDVLLTGVGKDKLAGKQGGDIFWVKEVDNFKKSGLDRIIDYDASNGDLILIGGSNQWSNLETSATYSIASSKKELKNESRSDTDFIYLTKGNKGLMFFNENGTTKGYGEGGLFLNFKGAPDITAQDIQIFTEL